MFGLNFICTYTIFGVYVSSVGPSFICLRRMSNDRNSSSASCKILLFEERCRRIPSKNAICFLHSHRKYLFLLVKCKFLAVFESHAGEIFSIFIRYNKLKHCLCILGIFSLTHEIMFIRVRW